MLWPLLPFSVGMNQLLWLFHVLILFYIIAKYYSLYYPRDFVTLHSRLVSSLILWLFHVGYALFFIIEKRLIYIVSTENFSIKQMQCKFAKKAFHTLIITSINDTNAVKN